jgi:signal transduction histidine kinase
VGELLRAGAFSCVAHEDPEATVALCFADLERGLRVGQVIEENERLVAQLKRQNRSFGHIVRERTRRLMEAYAELKRMDKLKLDLIALISHQIRTPLCTILGHSELIRSGYAVSGDELRFMAESIYNQGLRLTRFVDDATAFLGLRLGEQAPQESTFFLATAVAQAYERIRPKSESKRIDVTFDVPADLTVRSDLEKTADIVLRLLDNAVTYSPEGSSVRVGAESSGETVVLTIQDEGHGIDPEAVGYLFKPFELAREVKHHSDGNGLSLAICREMLKTLGGRVEIESEGHGRGCRVTVHLPAPVGQPVPAV